MVGSKKIYSDMYQIDEDECIDMNDIIPTYNSFMGEFIDDYYENNKLDFQKLSDSVFGFGYFVDKITERPYEQREFHDDVLFYMNKAGEWVNEIELDDSYEMDDLDACVYFTFGIFKILLDTDNLEFADPIVERMSYNCFWIDVLHDYYDELKHTLS